MAKHKTSLGPLICMSGVSMTLQDATIDKLELALGTKISPDGRETLAYARSWTIQGRLSEKNWVTAKQLTRAARQVSAASEKLRLQLEWLTSRSDETSRLLSVYLQKELDTLPHLKIPLPLMQFRLRDFELAVKRAQETALPPSTKGREPTRALHRQLILKLADVFEMELGTRPKAYYNDAEGGIVGNCLEFMRVAFEELECGLEKMKSEKSFNELIADVLARRSKKKPSATPRSGRKRVRNS